MSLFFQFGLTETSAPFSPKAGRAYFSDEYVLKLRPAGTWTMYLEGVPITDRKEIWSLFDWLPFKPSSDTVEVDDGLERKERDIARVISHFDIFSMQEIDEANELIECEFLPRYDPNAFSDEMADAHHRWIENFGS